MSTEEAPRDAAAQLRTELEAIKLRSMVGVSLAENALAVLAQLEAERAALRKALNAVAVLTGRTSDARLHIEHAREINRKEIPYKQRLDSELIDALTYLEAIHDKARELVTGDHPD